jgi:hypothetical protein
MANIILFIMALLIAGCAHQPSPELGNRAKTESAITAPDGYELQILDVTYGSIAKPKGWFYKYFTDKHSVVWTFSKEDTNFGSYLTGMRIQFVPGLSRQSKKTPQELAEQFISQKRDSATILNECQTTHDDDFQRKCIETREIITTTSGQVDFHILYSVFWSKTKDSIVLTTFGAPDAEWEKVRPIVDVMARFKLVGKDFWKKREP